MSKAGAEVILRSLLNLEIDVENLPWGPEDERVPAGSETVCYASEVRGRDGLRVEELEVPVKKEPVIMVEGEDGEMVVKQEEVE